MLRDILHLFSNLNRMLGLFLNATKVTKPVLKVSSGFPTKPDSNQSAQLQSLARIETRLTTTCRYFPKRNNKGADQTMQMRRLVCTFIVRMQQSQFFNQYTGRLSMASFNQKHSGQYVYSQKPCAGYKQLNTQLFLKIWRGKYPIDLKAYLEHVNTQYVEDDFGIWTNSIDTDQTAPI